MPEGTQWIPIGKIARAHGVRGELRVRVYGDITDWPVDVTHLRLCLGDKDVIYEVASVRPSHRAILLGLEGVVDRDRADSLRDSEIYIARSDLAVLAPGEFYFHDLVGCVVNDGTTDIGNVVGFIENKNQDILRIRDGDVERMLPLHAETIVHFDADAQRVVVLVPHGLWE